MIGQQVQQLAQADQMRGPRVLAQRRTRAVHPLHPQMLNPAQHMRVAAQLRWLTDLGELAVQKAYE